MPPFAQTLLSLGRLLLLQEQPQAQPSAFEWTYVWLGLGGLLLTLAVLAFGYLLVRRKWSWVSRVVRHSALRRADRFLAEHVPGMWGVIRRRFDAHQWHGLALTVAACFAFVAVYLFALITESWTDEDALYALDQRVYEWLVGATGEWVVSAMQVVTHLGDGLVVTLLSLALGGILLLRRHRWEVLALALSVGVGAAVMHGLKWVFERARPIEQAGQAVGHSFPSGHTFMAMTLYGFGIYLVWRFSSRDGVRIGATVALTLLIVLVGLSRVILRVHWVSDVAGGLAIGLAWLIVSLVLTRSLREYRSQGRASALSDSGAAGEE